MSFVSRNGSTEWLESMTIGCCRGQAPNPNSYADCDRRCRCLYRHHGPRNIGSCKWKNLWPVASPIFLSVLCDGRSCRCRRAVLVHHSRARYSCCHATDEGRNACAHGGWCTGLGYMGDRTLDDVTFFVINSTDLADGSPSAICSPLGYGNR